MARIVEEKLTIIFSRLVKVNDADPKFPVLDDEQLDTLRQAIEGLINDDSIVVEVLSK